MHTGEQYVNSCDPALPPFTMAEWQALQPGDQVRIRFNHNPHKAGDIVTVERTSVFGNDIACIVLPGHAAAFYAAAFSPATKTFTDELLSAFGGGA